MPHSLPIDSGARRAILDAATSLQPACEDLLARLVRHRSLLGHEQSCLAAMEEVYAGLGLTPYRVPVDVDVLAEHPGFSPPLIAYAGRDPVVAVHRPRATLTKVIALTIASWCGLETCAG